jgi:hypothetical protein
MTRSNRMVNGRCRCVLRDVVEKNQFFSYRLPATDAYEDTETLQIEVQKLVYSGFVTNHSAVSQQTSHSVFEAAQRRQMRWTSLV